MSSEPKAVTVASEGGKGTPVVLINVTQVQPQADHSHRPDTSKRRGDDEDDNEEEQTGSSFSQLQQRAPRIISQDDEGERFVDLGLGRGVDASDPNPWLNKTSFQVRNVLRENIIGTDEGSALHTYQKEVISAFTLQAQLKASIPVPQAPIAIGVDTEQSKSVASTKRVVGCKVLVRTISFREGFEDIPYTEQLSYESQTEEKEKLLTFEERLCRWIARRMGANKQLRERFKKEQPCDVGQQQPARDGGQQPVASGGQQQPAGDGGQQPVASRGQQQQEQWDEQIKLGWRMLEYTVKNALEKPAGDGGQQQRAGDRGQQQRAGDRGQQQRAGDGGQQQQAGDGGQQQRAGDGGQQQRAGDGGQQQQAGDGGQQQRAGNGGQQQRAGNGGQQQLTGDGGQQQRAGDGGQQQRAGDGGQQQRAGDRGQQQRADDRGQQQRAGDGGQQQRAGNGGQQQRAGNGGQQQLTGDGGQQQRAGDGGQQQRAGDGGQQQRAGDGGQQQQAGDGGQQQQAGDGGQQQRAGDGGQQQRAGNGGQQQRAVGGAGQRHSVVGDGGHQQLEQNQDTTLDDDLKKEVKSAVTKFVETFHITHYVSALSLGAVEYSVFTEEQYSSRFHARSSLGLSSAGASVSSTAEYKRTTRKSETRKIGRFKKEGKHRTVEAGSSGEAVIGIQVQPITNLIVHYPQLQKTMQRVLLSYLKKRQTLSRKLYSLFMFGCSYIVFYHVRCTWTCINTIELLAETSWFGCMLFHGIILFVTDGPFYITCDGDKKFLQVEGYKVYATTLTEGSTASKFYIIPTEDDEHQYEFYIAYRGGSMTDASSSSERKPDSEQNDGQEVEELQYYLSAPVPVAHKTRSGPLAMKLNVENQHARFTLRDRIYKSQNLLSRNRRSVDTAPWVAHRDTFYIRCARRGLGRKAFLAVQKESGAGTGAGTGTGTGTGTHPKYKTILVPDIHHHQESEDCFMLFRLLPLSYKLSGASTTEGGCDVIDGDSGGESDEPNEEHDP